MGSEGQDKNEEGLSGTGIALGVLTKTDESFDMEDMPVANDTRSEPCNKNRRNTIKGLDAGSTPTKRFQKTRTKQRVGGAVEYKEPDTSNVKFDAGLVSLSSSDGSSSSETGFNSSDDVSNAGDEAKMMPSNMVKLHNQSPSNAKEFFKATVSQSNKSNGEKPFYCKICRQKFTKKSSCDRHERAHTGEKPFFCNICHEKFTQRSDCKRHERTHTGEKPFSCKICHERFREKGSCNRHERTHTGEKPFSCKICHEKFTQRSNCQRHERMHTGEKSFSCKICCKKFVRKHDCQRHVERMHT